MPLRQYNAESDGAGFGFDRRLLESSLSLEELLASGGDRRLDLTQPEDRNSYGCTPYPRPAVLDFGSSTASNISERAFARARAAQARIWLDAARHGVPAAFDNHVEHARETLRTLLGIAGAEIVFSPSGTDAQLQALFLARALLGAPLTTIIAGSDQTGSGTAHTACGRHFSDCTSLVVQVEKGQPISGLSDQVKTIGIPFYDEHGQRRSTPQMDGAVYTAVAAAVARGEKVLLQAMDSSKLGWRAPSIPCLHHIAAAWPDQVCIVVDACQMRAGRPQLQDYLARGYFVLLTGSKFFTGPAFSGALLVPGSRIAAIANAGAPPAGLASYTTCHDWPIAWRGLREAFPTKPNYGQMLRWEAAMEEMKAYFDVPRTFRDGFLGTLAAQVPIMIGASPHLELVAGRGDADDTTLCDEMRNQTIFSFRPHRDGQALTPAQCSSLYQAMGRDVSRLLPQDASDDMRRIAARICQIGQPVILGDHRGAALRICASARQVSSNWAKAETVHEALLPVLAGVRAVIEKLDWLVGNPQFCEGP